MESGTLAPVLSYILTKMVERNDKIPLDDSKRTVFHAQKAPLISLHRYLERVLSFAPCSNSCFIIALIYIDRIIQNSDFILNSLSVHRMLITSVMLATKFFDDETFNNLYYAKVGGLQVNEVNQLENKFLSLIGFSLTIRSEIFDRYHCELVKHAKVNGHSKSINPASPLRSKLSHDFPSCQRLTEKGYHPLSRSTSSLNTKTSTSPTSKSIPQVASHSVPPLSHSQPLPQLDPTQPQLSQSTHQIRSICESLIAETAKNTLLESELLVRMTELLSVEEKLHHRLSPSSIKTMCAKLALEHNLPHSFIVQAAVQAERLERESTTKINTNNNSYQAGFDYTARDMIPTASDSSSNSCTSNTNTFGEVNPGMSTGAMKGRANFLCTPTFPSSNHIYGNRLLGVI
jgi:hypothetical protein